jgi:hypothetical protein
MGDIDFQGRFIEVRRSLVEGGRIELPKNGKIRRVDLSLLLGETLEKLRVRRAEETLAKGWKQVPVLQRGGAADLEVRRRATRLPQGP